MTGLASYVRTISRGEALKALVEEAKARAWVEDVEFAVLKLTGDERVMVQGGPGGIAFLTDEAESKVFMVHQEQHVQVERIFFHTHPRVTGPSDDDLKVLAILRQTRSYLFEIGGEPAGTLIRPKGNASCA